MIEGENKREQPYVVPLGPSSRTQGYPSTRCFICISKTVPLQSRRFFSVANGVPKFVAPLAKGILCTTTIHAHSKAVNNSRPFILFNNAPTHEKKKESVSQSSIKYKRFVPNSNCQEILMYVSAFPPCILNMHAYHTTRHRRERCSVRPQKTRCGGQDYEINYFYYI